MKNDREHQASKLRQKAEDLMRKNSSKTSIRDDTEKSVLIHELEVHQIELIMQNDELLLTNQNLENAVEKYTELYDSAPTGYLTLDRDGKITEINLSASDLLGKERKNLIYNTFAFFIISGYKTIFNDFLNKVFKTNARASCEIGLLTTQKKTIYVNIISHISKNGEHCDISMIDITEQKKADELSKSLLNDISDANRKIETQIREKKEHEAQLLTANTELENALRLNADKNRFISILAHDLRSPFSILLGFSELLLENINELDKDEIDKLVKEINTTSKNTFSLLEDLLKWARLESGKVAFKPQKLIFADIIYDTINFLSPSSDTKNIRLNYSAAENTEVYADVEMLKAVARNLLSNAIKFSNINSVVNVTAELTDSNFVFSVADSGVGIKPNDLSNLFDLSRDKITIGTSGEKGTGLGLFLCKGFIEKHGGKIWAESIYGKGSIFYFTIPVKTKKTEKHAVTEADEGNKIKKLKILIADDNESLRMILGEIVKKYSRETLFATNGSEAVSVMSANPDTDLILMDFFMPEMNGYEATKQIRQTNQNVTIFVETADSLSNVEAEFAGTGINDFFPKPYNKYYFNQLIIKNFSQVNTSGG
jgi:PAS domain S-box-containing protein